MDHGQVRLKQRIPLTLDSSSLFEAQTAVRGSHSKISHKCAKKDPPNHKIKFLHLSHESFIINTQVAQFWPPWAASNRCGCRNRSMRKEAGRRWAWSICRLNPSTPHTCVILCGFSSCPYFDSIMQFQVDRKCPQARGGAEHLTICTFNYCNRVICE